MAIPPLRWCGWTGWRKHKATSPPQEFRLLCTGPRGSMERPATHSACRRDHKRASMGTDKKRCWWPGEDPLYLSYHDSEWGVPEHDARALYEKLVLDGFQAGLSWITILRKRENFRKAFHNFAPEKIARYGTRHLDHVLKNAGIVRSRAKIEAAVKGAKLWLEIEE